MNYYSNIILLRYKQPIRQITISQRLKRIQFETLVLKDPYVHGAPEERTKELQAQALLAAARGVQLLVALDAGGMSLNSVELADLWTRWEEQGRTSVALLIGGHLGLAQSLLDRASYPLALSSPL